MEFNSREEAEDVVRAMQQMEPDQLLQIEPYQTFLIKAIGGDWTSGAVAKAEDYCHHCSDHALLKPPHGHS